MTPSLLVGVIGPAGHGRTALIRALAGPDRPDTDASCGVPMAAASVLPNPRGAAGGWIDLLDLPAHDRCVREMIGGGIRAVLLATAANEGLQPQFVGRLEIARRIGVRRGVVALTKCDLVGPEAVAARKAELAAAATRAGLDPPAVVATSALAGTGLLELEVALGALLRDTPAPCGDGFAYLPIDRVFARPGAGAVVTGTLRRGRLSAGDRIEIMPDGRKATVEGVRVHGCPVEAAEPGRRVAVALREVEAGTLRSGQALAVPGMLSAGRWIDVALSAASGAEAPLRDGAGCHLLFGTTEVPARLHLPDRDGLEPGGSTHAQLRTEEDVAVPVHEPFILRGASPDAALAGGQLLGVAPGPARADPAYHGAEQVRALEAVFRDGGLSPPDERMAVGRDIRRRDALARLLAAGTLIRAPDRVQKRAILFHRDAIAGAMARLAEVFPEAGSPEAGFLAREAGAALGISRKFSIPLLEHLDAIGFTRRVGDRRLVLRPEAGPADA